jgi:hypothetical protein
MENIVILAFRQPEAHNLILPEFDTSVIYHTTYHEKSRDISDNPK